MMEIFGGAAFSIDIQAYMAIVFRGSGTTMLVYGVGRSALSRRFNLKAASTAPASITTPYHLGNQAVSYEPPLSKDSEGNDTRLSRCAMSSE
jgi:hypothetical protein